MEMMGGDPGRMGHRPPRMHGDSIHRPHEFNPEHRGEMERHGEGRMMDRHHDHRPPIGIGLSHLFQLVVMILMLGMNLGVKLYFKNLEDQKEMRELESRSLSQQLAYLKYQINPHFYMNTLNNIHALVDIDPERAKETILILSRIMRYVLYEADKHLVPVGREVEFLMNYIHLMKLRYTDKVSITTDIPAEMPDAEIPPLVFITFVENAFKHGVSYKQQSFVDIHLQFSDGRLRFSCRNSKPVVLEERGKRKEESGERKEESEKKNGGVGLANVKQRLDIIYDNDYTLDIQDNADTYEVLLLLPINRDV
jgi:LytS/YehU family sensor histidine kinase